MEMNEKLSALVSGQGALARGQGALVEVVALLSLPAKLSGCERVLLATDADLDQIFGAGTAATIKEVLLGSTAMRDQVLRCLLRAVAVELRAKRPSKALKAKKEPPLPTQQQQQVTAAVEATAAADEAAAAAQMPQAAQEEAPAQEEEMTLDRLQAQMLDAASGSRSPDVTSTRGLLQKAKTLLQQQPAADEVQGSSSRWGAAFTLLKYISTTGDGSGGDGCSNSRESSSSSSPKGSSSTDRSDRSQALLLLFLLAEGRLRDELDLDLLVRFHTTDTALWGQERHLVVGEVKCDLSELGRAREQLKTALAVLELACRFRPIRTVRDFARPYKVWQPPSLEARAVVCGILDGKVVAKEPGLLDELQVPLVSLDLLTPAWDTSMSAPTPLVMRVPLEVYRLGCQRPLTAGAGGPSDDEIIT